MARTSYVPAPRVDEPKVAFLLYQGGRRGGASRWRLKKVIIPASADKVRVDGPGTFTMDDGKKTYGAEVRYWQRGWVRDAQPAGTYPKPVRAMARRRVVSLAKPASHVRLLDVAAKSRAREVEAELLRMTGATAE